MAAFVAQELQKLGRAVHVVHGGGIGLIGEVVHSATEGEAVSMERHHAIEGQVTAPTTTPLWSRTEKG